MKINKEKIDAALRRRKMSQADLARKLGMKSRQLLQYHLNAEYADLKTAEAIAKELGMNPKNILS